MRWILMTVILAGCAQTPTMTPYMTRLQAECSAGNSESCGDLTEVRAKMGVARGNEIKESAANFASVLLDIGIAVSNLPF